MPRTHVPVLAGELIEALDPRPGQVAIDCTLGAAGGTKSTGPVTEGARAYMLP